MLGLLLAMQMLLVAKETAQHAESDLRMLSSGPAAHAALALALVDTHNRALARIRSGADASMALRGTRRAGAHTRICADNSRMLTAYGPTIETAAPDFRHAIRQALHPKVRHGHSGASGSVPAAVLPAGCSVPPDHVWIGTRLD